MLKYDAQQLNRAILDQLKSNRTVTRLKVLQQENLPNPYQLPLQSQKGLLLNIDPSEPTLNITSRTG